MALLTKKEFAEQCGIKTNNLSVYIGRGKVIADSNDLINTKNDKNRAFLEKSMAKRSEMSVIKDLQLIDPDIETISSTRKKKKVLDIKFIEDDDGDNSDGIPAFHTSERKLKYLDAIKRQKEIEKLEIDIDKKKGVVIPSELVKPVFMQHNQSIVTEFKNGADEIIRVISKKKSMNAGEVSDIRGQLVKIINESISKATKLSVKAVDNIINEFSESRGVGERK